MAAKKVERGAKIDKATVAAIAEAVVDRLDERRRNSTAMRRVRELEKENEELRATTSRDVDESLRIRLEQALADAQKYKDAMIAAEWGLHAICMIIERPDLREAHPRDVVAVVRHKMKKRGE